MRFIAICLCFASMPGFAQTSDAGADVMLSTSMASTAKAMYGSIRRNIVEAAEAMPAEGYAFKATPAVRTFAQLVGHVTNANRLFCSAAKGEPFPSKINAETLTSRETALKELTDSFTYCDSAFQSLTDATFGDHVMVAGGGNKPTETTRGTVLTFNTTHNNEHYGNMVVYLRLKDIVPPSTARAQAGRK